MMQWDRGSRTSNVEISEDGLTASRKSGWNGAVVRTSRPLPTPYFEVEITERRTEWSGSLKLRLLPTAEEACPSAIADESGFVYNHLRNNTEVGDRVGVLLSRRNEMVVFHNGKAIGVTATRVGCREPLWGYAEIYASTGKCFLGRGSGSECTTDSGRAASLRLTEREWPFDTGDQWSPAIHMAFPAATRRAVEALHVLQRRDEGRGGGFELLPRDILTVIAVMVAGDLRERRSLDEADGVSHETTAKQN
eukprot:m51a1_g45 hypothetical protein (250) ;mRNA; f:157585-158408